MSEEGESQEIIIVRRRVEGEDGHHGGAWKIAYADFVTAMMAFFLVLWILNSTNKDSQTIIARYFNPVKMEDFAKNKRGIREQQDKEQQQGPSEGEPNKSPPEGEKKGGQQPASGESPKEPQGQAQLNDETLFKNPYAALDQIAGRAPAPRKGMTGASSGQQGALDAFHDPFRAAGAETESEDAGAPPPDQPPPAPQTPAAQTAAGQPAAGPSAPAPAAAANDAATDAAREKSQAAALQKEIVKAEKALTGDNGPRVEVNATAEGLLISLTDKESFGMFEIGSSQPNAKLVHLMEKIAATIKDQPGAVVLRGYTDARPYRNGASDNWRLSASRAQMALYMLARGGLPESRLERVEGYADHKLKNTQNPDAAENRRIEILLRKPSSGGAP